MEGLRSSRRGLQVTIFEDDLTWVQKQKNSTKIWTANKAHQRGGGGTTSVPQPVPNASGAL